jgi:hypothetical protein
VDVIPKLQPPENSNQPAPKQAGGLWKAPVSVGIRGISVAWDEAEIGEAVDEELHRQGHQ